MGVAPLIPGPSLQWAANPIGGMVSEALIDVPRVRV